MEEKNHQINESMSDEGDCRTAPATPGLLNTLKLLKFGIKKTISFPCKIGLDVGGLFSLPVFCRTDNIAGWGRLDFLPVDSSCRMSLVLN